jgi:phosphohistidine phosphatase SixA
MAAHIRTSSQTGEGLEVLRQLIHTCLTADTHAAGRVVSSTAARCRESLRLAAEHLHEAQQAALAELGEELVAA